MKSLLGSGTLVALLAMTCLHCGGTDEEELDARVLETLDACGFPTVCDIAGYTSFPPDPDTLSCIYTELGSGRPTHVITRSVADGGPNCGDRTDLYALGNGEVMVVHGPDEPSCSTVDEDDRAPHYRLDRCKLKSAEYFAACSAKLPPDTTLGHEEELGGCLYEWYDGCERTTEPVCE